MQRRCDAFSPVRLLPCLIGSVNPRMQVRLSEYCEVCPSYHKPEGNRQRNIIDSLAPPVLLYGVVDMHLEPPAVLSNRFRGESI